MPASDSPLQKIFSTFIISGNPAALSVYFSTRFQIDFYGSRTHDFLRIYGYYFGIAKFANPILQQKLWLGEKAPFVSFMSKILGLNEGDTYKELTMFKGLFIVMVGHAAYDFSLNFQFWHRL